MQNHKSNHPLGKIIDDLQGYFRHAFPKENFFLKANRDMVDSNMMTLPITGYYQNGVIRRVDVLTFDIATMAERSKLALGSIKLIENRLKIVIPKKIGHIYCISESKVEGDPFNVEIIQNQYPLEYSEKEKCFREIDAIGERSF